MPAEPFGRYLINKDLPEEYKVKGLVTKKELQEQMSRFAKERPSEYVTAISNIKNTGDMVSTLEGLSIGLDDIAPDYTTRDRVLAPYKQRFSRAKSESEKKKIAIEAQQALVDTVMKHPGSLTHQVRTGARGNKVQYAAIASGVGYARDAKGDVLPWLIEKSYAEGLRPGDYWALTNQSMMDTIKSQTSVSEPGDLSKKLVSSMADAVITEEDCGTHAGIMMSADSPDVLDRYLATNVGSFKRNTLITPVNQSKLAKVSRQILVRSPMTCEATDGICQKCQGLDEKGNVQPLGINVGIRAAQAMAEPLTQFALNSKHGGRTLSSDKSQVFGIKGFRQIVETPKHFVNKAALAVVPGTITDIKPAPQGGTYVYVDKEKHYVSPELAVTRKKGDVVAAGDVLSEGIPKPDEIVRLKGLGAGRVYMVNTLKNIYENQGRELDSRHFEILAKSSMNHVRVLEDPSHTFIKGDVINYNMLRKELSRDAKQVSLMEALGGTLGKPYLHFAAGTRVTPEIVSALKDAHIKEIYIAPRAPEVEFVMKSLTNIPKMNADWLARMAHRGIKSTIMQAAQTGEKSNIHGTHPVPAYVYGLEFGEGPEGRY